MFRKWFGAGVLFAVLAVGVPTALTLIPAAPAWGAEAEGGYTRRTLWDNVKAGGLTELWIILISVVAMALAIQSFVELRRDRQIPPALLQEIEGLIEEQNYEGAIELCESEDNVLANVVGGALGRMSAGYQRMVEGAGEALEESTSILNTRIGYQALIATVAPMLGLLGTVIGMIEAFDTLAALKGAANPAELADSISKALVTTATGLIVAIPVLVIYMYLKTRIIRITQEVSIIVGEILDHFRPQQQ